MKKLELQNKHYRDMVIMPIIAKKIKLYENITKNDKKDIYMIFQDYIDLLREVSDYEYSVICKK